MYYFAPVQQPALETDTLYYALGVVLSQTINKKLHPAVFHFRKFSSTELNNEIYDKEILPIVTAFKESKDYQEGSKLQEIVFTDHKNLVYFMKESQ